MAEARVSPAKRRRIVELRLDALSYQAIADELGLSPTAVREALGRPDVKEAMTLAREQRMEGTRLALERSGVTAVRALLEGATQKHTSKVAVLAADSILDRIGIPRKAMVEQKITSATSLDAFDGRSPEDCEFFAANGCWPEEKGSRT